MSEVAVRVIVIALVCLFVGYPLSRWSAKGRYQSKSDSDVLKAGLRIKLFFLFGAAFFFLCSYFAAVDQEPVADLWVIVILLSGAIGCVWGAYYLSIVRIGRTDRGLVRYLFPLRDKSIDWSDMIKAGYGPSGCWVKGRSGLKFRWSEYLDGADELLTEVEEQVGKNLDCTPL